MHRRGLHQRAPRASVGALLMLATGTLLGGALLALLALLVTGQPAAAAEGTIGSRTPATPPGARRRAIEEPGAGSVRSAIAGAERDLRQGRAGDTAVPPPRPRGPRAPAGQSGARRHPLPSGGRRDVPANIPKLGQLLEPPRRPRPVAGPLALGPGDDDERKRHRPEPAQPPQRTLVGTVTFRGPAGSGSTSGSLGGRSMAPGEGPGDALAGPASGSVGGGSMASGLGDPPSGGMGTLTPSGQRPARAGQDDPPPELPAWAKLAQELDATQRQVKDLEARLASDPGDRDAQASLAEAKAHLIDLAAKWYDDPNELVPRLIEAKSAYTAALKAAQQAADDAALASGPHAWLVHKHQAAMQAALEGAEQHLAGMEALQQAYADLSEAEAGLATAKHGGDWDAVDAAWARVASAREAVKGQLNGLMGLGTLSLPAAPQLTGPTDMPVLDFTLSDQARAMLDDPSKLLSPDIVVFPTLDLGVNYVNFSMREGKTYALMQLPAGFARGANAQLVLRFPWVNDPVADAVLKDAAYAVLVRGIEGAMQVVTKVAAQPWVPSVIAGKKFTSGRWVTIWSMGVLLSVGSLAKQVAQTDTFVIALPEAYDPATGAVVCQPCELRYDNPFKLLNGPVAVDPVTGRKIWATPRDYYLDKLVNMAILGFSAGIPLAADQLIEGVRTNWKGPRLTSAKQVLATLAIVTTLSALEQGVTDLIADPPGRDYPGAALLSSIAHKVRDLQRVYHAPDPRDMVENLDSALANEAAGWVLFTLDQAGKLAGSQDAPSPAATAEAAAAAAQAGGSPLAPVVLDGLDWATPPVLRPSMRLIKDQLLAMAGGDPQAMWRQDKQTLAAVALPEPGSAAEAAFQRADWAWQQVLKAQPPHTRALALQLVLNLYDATATAAGVLALRAAEQSGLDPAPFLGARPGEDLDRLADLKLQRAAEAIERARRDLLSLLAP